MNMISLKPKYIKRYGQIAHLLLKYGREDFVDSFGLRPALNTNGQAQIDSRAKPAELAADLEAMGPAYVKLAQLLSTRADLLPPPYLESLARLQDHVAPVDFEDIRDI